MGIPISGGGPDDASDLFGYTPRRPASCPACGAMAEPYYGKLCWLCVVTGAAGRLLRDAALTQSDIDGMTNTPALSPAEKAAADPKPDGWRPPTPTLATAKPTRHRVDRRTRRETPPTDD